MKHRKKDKQEEEEVEGPRRKSLPFSFFSKLKPPMATSDPNNASGFSLTSAASASTNSPANKRRSSSFRKWLTNPVRKLSQSRIDKTALDKSQNASDGSASGSGVSPGKGTGSRHHVTSGERKTGHSKFYLKNLLPGAEDQGAVCGRGSGASDQEGIPGEPPLAQQEDLPSEASNSAHVNTTTHSTNHKPLSRLEQVETPESNSVNSAPPGGDHTALPGAETEDEGEEEGAVELPPPMQEIHTLPLPLATGAAPTATPPSGVVTEEDVHAKLTSTLQMKSETNGLTDLAQEIESMVLNRHMGDGSADGDVTPSGGDAETAQEVTSEMSEEESTRAKNLHKRKFVITELIETEKDYVRDIGLIVDGYFPALKEAALPEGMEGKDKMVFGNIHQIYDWHQQTFKAEVERCEDEPERLGGIFIRYEKRLYMYVKYCENKPKSEFIVAEYIDFFEELRQKMGHRLMLPDLLIKPVQRIMKYKLLLQDILKYTERAGEDTKDLQRAVEVMCVVPKAANDMMNVGRLQGFRGKITAQGKLLLQDTLQVLEQSPKAKEQAKFRERRVFLFEQIIIISEELERKKNALTQPGYIYKNSLLANKMSLNQAGLDSDPLTFTLIDKTPGSDLRIVIQAPSDEVKANWVTQIRSILDMQGDFLKALQAPIAYQRDQLTKELSAPEFGQPQQQGRNSLLRKTQSQPQPQKGGKDKKHKGKKSSKVAHAHEHSDSHDRGRHPPHVPPLDGAGVAHAELERKTSCPTSPTSKEGGLGSGEKQKLENKKTAPGALGGGGSGATGSHAHLGGATTHGGGSPKPKRNIFEGLKNTLRPKSKSQDNSSNSSNQAGHQGASSTQTSNSTAAGSAHASTSPLGGSSHSASSANPQVYANMHSMPELNVAATEGTPSGANSHDRKSSGAGSVMTSSVETETAATSAVSH